MNSGVPLLLRAAPRISSTSSIPIRSVKAARPAISLRPLAFSHPYYTLDIPLKNRLDLVFPPDASDMEAAGGTARASHLCVLVHGLWGNPTHMKNIAKCLREQYPADDLYLLLAKRNTGSFTYDGIERGGERVCSEIEEELASIEKQGGKITKLSIIGYSLGGLVSRYAVGLLEAKGVLDRVECMNFTTFASPHLGVRTPLKGWHNNVWNVVGARTLSMSGRQLFTIDDFRDTNRPLLSVMADTKSIFMSGLRKFKRHTLYSNIVNDRSAVYYTTAIQKTDPYLKMGKLNMNFLNEDKYGQVLLDPAAPFMQRPKLTHTTYASVGRACLYYVKKIPVMVAVAIFVPIGVAAYLLNSVIQNLRSYSRIKLHEKGELGVSIEEYRVPLLIKELRGEVENAYEVLSNAQGQEFLGIDDDEDDVAMNSEERDLMVRERRLSIPTQPTLALTPHQFEMIRSLDTLNWRKYPVWIHNVRHSHGAIIARIDKSKYDEGYVVLKHYIDEEFLI